MAGTISSTLTATYTLVVNPTTITNTGAVIVAAGDAITGNAASAWSVLNLGTVDDSGGAGVYLFGAGTVTNAASALIGGGTNGGINIQLLGTVSNAGTIRDSTASGNAINLASGGVVTNAPNGVILGAFRGIFSATTAAVTNQGTILNSNTDYSAISIRSGGTLTNLAGGLVQGQSYHAFYAYQGAVITNAAGGTLAGGDGAVFVVGGAATLSNAGVIVDTGTHGDAAQFYGYRGGLATVTNQGTILAAAGADEGVRLGAGGAVTNVAGGTIQAGYAGIDVVGAGAVVNQAGATVTGGRYGVRIQSGTVTNAGSIGAAGTAFAVQFGSNGAADRLVFDPGAVFTGTVSGGHTVGGTAVSTLELASGGSAGTLSGLGTQFVDFAQVTVDAGATWTMAAGNTLGGGGTLTNAGTLTSASYGVLLSAGGAVINNLDASITSSGRNGVQIQGVGSVLNTGTIADNAAGWSAVYLKNGGNVTNAAFGLIQSGYHGIDIYLGAGTVTNQGTVLGTDARYSAIVLDQGGTVTNLAGGFIQGGYDGVYLAGSGTILNAAGATMVGGHRGVGLYGGAITLTNAGTIVQTGGSGDAVYFKPGFADRLIVDPGAVFTGTVTGGNTLGAATSSTLELASAAATGTLAGLGTQIIDFTQITLDAGAKWLLSGDAAGIAAGQTIAGFAAGDTIEITGLTETIQAFANNQLILGGTEALTIDLPGTFTTADLLATAVTGGTDVTVACFLKGTHIATAAGDMPVESLAIGDRVRTRHGRLRPIKWIGRRSYAGAFARANPNLAPIRFAPGSLADGVPHAALYVSPEHALFLDNVLVPARHMVNGISVTVADGTDPIVYYHIELETHDVIAANGAWSETFVDCDSRNIFHNVAEYTARYPDEPARTPRFCAAVIEDGPRLAAIAARLARRAARIGAPVPRGGALVGYLDGADHRGVRGWAWLPDRPDVPVLLEVTDQGRPIGHVLANQYRADLEAAGHGDGRHAFDLSFDPPLDPMRAHRIAVRRAADGAALTGSPRHLAGPGRAGRAATLAAALAEAAASVRTPTEAASLTAALAEAEAALRMRRVTLLDQAAPGTPRRGAPPARKRALVIDTVWPRPDRDAGAQAIISHMRALRRLGFQVAFVAQQPGSVGPESLAALAAAGVEPHAPPLIAGVEQALTAHRYELIYLHRGPIGFAYAGLARSLQPEARLVCSVADLHHLRLSRQATVEDRPELRRAARALRAQEALAARQVDAILTHSPAEAPLLAALAPETAVHIVPWAVRRRPPPPPFAARDGAVFVANFAHPPNADGLLWLVRDVMPLVWGQDPAITLTAVGEGVPRGLAAILVGPRVRLVGPVDDLTPYYRAARLTVAPLRFGAGIKGKVLEAWAYGLPCAMTPIAAEGLGAAVAPATAADAPALAGLILALHRDPVGAAAAAAAGAALLRREFSAAAVRAALERVLEPPAIVPRAPRDLPAARRAG